MTRALATLCSYVVRPSGEAYTYDNVSFALTGLAVENVTSSPFSKYMEKNIFKPLDMKSTSMSFTSDPLKRLATPYGPPGDPNIKQISSV